MFQTDPLLSPVDRAVGIYLLSSMNKRWEPVEANLDSQALMAARVGCWRETANRSLRKLVTLGYFSTTWKTVQRATAQGIKGVTRVLVSVGSVVRPFVEQSGVSAGKRRGVISHHPPRTPPGTDLAVSSSAVANSADRKGRGPSDTRDDKRNALAQWPRLAGSRPRDVTQLRTHIPIELVRDPAAYRRYVDELEAEQSRRVKKPRRSN
jgi:hypothetical protein